MYLKILGARYQTPPSEGGCSSGGQKGVVGYYVHCNRLNGPNGNHTCYSSHIGAQAIKNFYHSEKYRVYIIK